MSEKPQPAASPRIGEYRLLTKIGEGGMGVVHLAQAPDGRRVALKVLRPHIVGDDEARARLAREVASLCRVKSPRIAEIIDADPWGDTPFVATRYVPGLSLHEQVRQEGPVTGEDLRWLAAGLAEAVIAVHSVGVLHRDIKPTNILMEGRAPVLIDFGLARLAEDPRLTLAGWLLGTPGYLAPEILYGDDATSASDVHSWAATVAYAATGYPPFGRGPAVAVMDRVRRGEHDLSAVPVALLPLLRSCLSPDPLERPETAAVLADLRASGGAVPDGDREDDHTMPFSVFAARDDDPTDLIGPNEPTIATPRPTPPPTMAQPTPVTPPTRLVAEQPRPPSIAEQPPLEPRTRAMPVQTPQQQPARAPYMSPTPPQRQPVAAQPPREQARASESGPVRIQRGALLTGLFVLVTVGFAAAPYLCLVLVGVATLALRTASWATDAARERRYRRGRQRWYDGALTALTSPWYLLVATAGSLLLLMWSAGLAFIVGLAYLLFRLPGVPGLLAMGAVLALSLWWGPGSRRVRVPMRALMVRSTGESWLGWVCIGVVVAGVALCGYFLMVSGVNWDPQPGAPWRNGTILGGIVGLL